MTKRYKHQRRALTKSKGEDAFAYFMEMGTGKTLIGMDDAMRQSDCDAALMIVPNTLLYVWAAEIQKFYPDKSTVIWPRWLSTPRIPQPDNPDFYLIATESLSHRSIRDKAEKIIKGRRIFMFLDESHFIKKHSSKRSKNIQYLGDKYGHVRRIATGTPITKSLGDLYSQFRFLAPHVFGTNFKAFESRYIEMGGYHVEIVRGGKIIKKPTKVIGYKNQAELRRKMAPYVFQQALDDCVDLPPKVYHRRDCQMGPEQAKYYAEMRDTLVTMIADEKVSASIILTKMLRLQQIISGFTKTDEGNTIHFPSTKLDALQEVIEERDSQVLTFIKFKPEADAIVSLLASMGYMPQDIGLLHGSVKPEERQSIISKFESDNNRMKFLIANIEMAVGYTVLEARTTVFYTNSFNYGTRIQAEARARRIGQTKTCNYIDLVMAGTIDVNVLEILAMKKSLADVIREIEL